MNQRAMVIIEKKTGDVDSVILLSSTHYSENEKIFEKWCQKQGQDIYNWTYEITTSVYRLTT